MLWLKSHTGQYYSTLLNHIYTALFIVDALMGRGGLLHSCFWHCASFKSSVPYNHDKRKSEHMLYPVT